MLAIKSEDPDKCAMQVGCERNGEMAAECDVKTASRCSRDRWRAPAIEGLCQALVPNLFGLSGIQGPAADVFSLH